MARSGLSRRVRRKTGSPHEMAHGGSMKNPSAKTGHTPDEKAILALVDRWSKAVREEDRAAIRQDHDANTLIFDVPPPFSSRGIDAYMATWETFLASSEKPVTFHFTDVEITAGSEVAFVTAVGHCINIDKAGQREPLDFRL